MIKVDKPLHFSIRQIAESGQCFRFKCLNKSKTKYSTVYKDNYVEIEQLDSENKLAVSCGLETWETIWEHYFDLDTDYGKYLELIASLDDRYDYLKKAAQFGEGIRILNQEPVEMLISFIISQRNSIPRICKSVESLAETYGNELQDKFTGTRFYTFPTEAELPESVNEYKQLGFGYRSLYLSNAAWMLKRLGIECYTSKEAAMDLYGVGEKVANCYCLFGLHKMEMFPVDVWMQYIIDKYFGGNIDTTPFKDFAGLAQQYMFYYERYFSGKIK